MNHHTILVGDCLESLTRLEAESVQCFVTSPPYWALRDYGVPKTAWPEVVFSPMAGLPPLTIPAMECCHGLETDLWAYVAHEVAVFREVRRVLRKDGLLWLNLGDTYSAGGTTGGGERGAYNGARSEKCGQQLPSWRTAPANLQRKDLCGIPWRVAFALQADGWILRCDVVWSKTNPMPESTRDRPTKAHEYIFLFAKGPRPFYDATAIMEKVSGTAHPRGHGVNRKAKMEGKNSRMKVAHDPAHQTPRKAKQNVSFSKAVRGLVSRRNKRSVWTFPTSSYQGAHFATFPPELPRLCIAASTRPGDVVADCFGGSGTTASVALKMGRKAITMEIGAHHVPLIEERTSNLTLGML